MRMSPPLSPLSTSYWDLLYNMGLILTATKIWRLSLRLSPSSAFRLTASGETSSTFLHIASHQRQKFCSNLSLRWPTSWKLINTDQGCTSQNQNGKGTKTRNSNSGCKKLQLGAILVSNPASCGSVTQHPCWGLSCQLHWKKYHHWLRLSGHHGYFLHRRKFGIAQTWHGCLYPQGMVPERDDHDKMSKS